MQACWSFPRSRTLCRNVRTKQTKHTKSGVRTASPAKRRSFCLRAQVMANVQSSGAHVIWPGMASDWCLFDRPLEPCYAPSMPAINPLQAHVVAPKTAPAANWILKKQEAFDILQSKPGWTQPGRRALNTFQRHNQPYSPIIRQLLQL